MTVFTEITILVAVAVFFKPRQIPGNPKPVQ